jgi:predicted ATPase
MIVNFVGAAGSGKTTTAAMLFAQLKQQHIVCEFITEQARIYIAQYRLDRNVKPNEEIHFHDFDQLDIMSNQSKIEHAFINSVGNGVVITDSSPLNALLYMSQWFKDKRKIDCHIGRQLNDLIEQSVKNIDVVFFCPITRSMVEDDHNRIHSFEQSIEVEKSIKPIFTECCPAVIPIMIELNGDIEGRYQQALEVIVNRRDNEQK